MNILYLTEINPYVYNGGGQIIEKGVIEKLKSRGHSVIINTPNEEKNIPTVLSSTDIVISWDIFNEPEKGQWFSPHILHLIMEHGKYIHGNCGYSDCCNRWYNPCNGTKSSRCRKCFSIDDFILSFWNNSKAHIFLSPLHAKTAFKIMDIENPNTYILIPEIDRKIYENYNNNDKREIDYLYAGVICEAKGYYNICEYIERNNLFDKNIVFIGDSLVGKPRYGTWINKLERDKVFTYMSKSKNFISLPRWNEPYSLASVEAIFCGCNLIYNENLGCMSYFKSTKEALLYDYSLSYNKFCDFLEELF